MFRQIADDTTICFSSAVALMQSLGFTLQPNRTTRPQLCEQHLRQHSLQVVLQKKLTFVSVLVFILSHCLDDNVCIFVQQQKPLMLLFSC